MSKGGHDIFTLVVNFLRIDWQPKHITLGLFEATGNSAQTLAKNLTKLLESYALKRNFITYIKDEGSNMKTMTTTLKSIVS
jgi:hypothetical protein